MISILPSLLIQSFYSERSQAPLSAALIEPCELEHIAMLIAETGTQSSTDPIEHSLTTSFIDTHEPYLKDWLTVLNKNLEARNKLVKKLQDQAAALAKKHLKLVRLQDQLKEEENDRAHGIVRKQEIDQQIVAWKTEKRTAYEAMLKARGAKRLKVKQNLDGTTCSEKY